MGALFVANRADHIVILLQAGLISPLFACRKVCRPGIPEDKLKKVFEPFYTSKSGGMGMGLSIARTIIEAHHGLIWAKNRDHGGATFRIRLSLV
jgi:light-regulated signal transduction histidine kinase (bacteriophytochrome)